MNQVVKYLTLLAIGTFAGLIAGGLGTSTAYALILGLVFTGISKDYKHAAALTLFTILPPLSLGAVFTYYKKKMIDILQEMWDNNIWIYTSIAGALLGAAFLAYFRTTIAGIYLYQQFDEFLDKIIDRYGWTWFTQKQSETEKKLIELEKRIEDLENK